MPQANDKVQKHWTIGSLEGERFDFTPVWQVLDREVAGASGKDVECQYIKVRVGEKDYTFNYLDIFMFIYFTANEELRKNLAMRYERKVYYIPYDVTFKLDAREKEEGMAKRRIELPIDDLTMAIARNEALSLKDPTGKVKDWVVKGKK